MFRNVPTFWILNFKMKTPYSGFLYNRGDGINVVMDKKVEILIMVSWL